MVAFAGGGAGGGGSDGLGGILGREGLDVTLAVKLAMRSGVCVAACAAPGDSAPVEDDGTSPYASTVPASP